MATFVRLYPGKIYEIWITKQNSGSQVMEFGDSRPPATYRKLRSIVERTANEGKYTSTEIYNPIGNGIYEFKAHSARVYSFNDGQRIILTHGANKPKSHAGVIHEQKLSIRTRTEYNNWKGQKD